MQKKLIKKKKKKKPLYFKLNGPDTCAGQRFFPLLCDRAAIFQTEMVLTGHKGRDVTPAASTPAWFGPTMLVDGYLMAVMSCRVSTWKPFSHPTGTSRSHGSTRRMLWGHQECFLTQQLRSPKHLGWHLPSKGLSSVSKQKQTRKWHFDANRNSLCGAKREWIQTLYKQRLDQCVRHLAAFSTEIA